MEMAIGDLAGRARVALHVSTHSAPGSLWKGLCFFPRQRRQEWGFTEENRRIEQAENKKKGFVCLPLVCAFWYLDEIVGFCPSLPVSWDFYYVLHFLFFFYFVNATASCHHRWKGSACLGILVSTTTSSIQIRISHPTAMALFSGEFWTTFTILVDSAFHNPCSQTGLTQIRSRSSTPLYHSTRTW